MPSVANLFLHGHNSPAGSVARQESLENPFVVTQTMRAKVPIVAGSPIDRLNVATLLASNSVQNLSGPTDVPRAC